MEINGKRVVHGKTPFTLKITKTDIRRGKSKDPGACAAAIAVMREFPEVQSVRVHIGRIFVETPKEWVRYKTPHTLRDEIVAFDRGGEFLPGSHEVKTLTEGEQRYIDDKVWRKRVAEARAREPAKKDRKKRITHIVPGVRARGANK